MIWIEEKSKLVVPDKHLKQNVLSYPRVTSFLAVNVHGEAAPDWPTIVPANEFPHESPREHDIEHPEGKVFKVKKVSISKVMPAPLPTKAWLLKGFAIVFGDNAVEQSPI